MMPFEHDEGRAALSQPQSEAAGMLNHPGPNADDLLHHRADPSTLGGMPHRAVGADQGRLADGAQDVEGQHRQTEHQIVGGELARRQPRIGNRQLLTWGFEKNKKKIEIAVSGPLIVNSVDLMVKATRDGIGIGYMAETYMSRDIEEGRLIPMLTDWSPTYDSWYLYYAGRQHLSAPLKAFIQFLRDHLRKKDPL